MSAEISDHRILADENGDGPGDEKSRHQAEKDMLAGVIPEQSQGLGQGILEEKTVDRIIRIAGAGRLR